MMTIILVTISVSEAFYFRNLVYRESKLLESYIITCLHAQALIYIKLSTYFDPILSVNDMTLKCI